MLLVSSECVDTSAVSLPVDRRTGPGIGYESDHSARAELATLGFMRKTVHNPRRSNRSPHTTHRAHNARSSRYPSISHAVQFLASPFELRRHGKPVLNSKSCAFEGFASETDDPNVEYINSTMLIISLCSHHGLPVATWQTEAYGSHSLGSGLPRGMSNPKPFFGPAFTPRRRSAPHCL